VAVAGRRSSNPRDPDENFGAVFSRVKSLGEVLVAQQLPAQRCTRPQQPWRPSQGYPRAISIRGLGSQLPDCVVHCDWSASPAKRVAATATLGRDGSYHVGEPRVVGAKGTWYERLGLPARATSILVGFDFVIGLPLAYAQRAGFSSFREALSVFGAGEWGSFYQVCRAPCEVTLWRPFFPKSCGRRGMALRGHLSRGLGLTWAELHRECEKRTLSRPSACPLFWTLGANQVGKASISGWLEVLRPMTEGGAELVP
jgi:hypothetical protein